MINSEKITYAPLKLLVGGSVKKNYLFSCLFFSQINFFKEFALLQRSEHWLQHNYFQIINL